uniref:Death domain-containing protein n=1 Tax=Branchiostoma floridae TaxID=7739 RepID=C3Y7Z5_BRAFL|eukprot:XP_002607640.1 hypothetical protein BRAFLDRAFT_84671 [Branchiostoma floridae]
MSKQGVKKYFSFIKNRVSSDWKDLAWHLGFETPDIDNLDGKHKDDKSRCMDLLQQWYKREGHAATIHVLMEALQDAELQHVVDSLKDKYQEVNEKPKSPTSSSEQQAIRKAEELHFPDQILPVHLQLGLMQTGDISKEHKEQIIERILELEKTLFTPEVLNDPVRYRKVRKLFIKHKALLRRALKGSVILLLTFLRQTDVDRFYHNHYRVGEGSLSQQLSHILISEHLQDKVKGAQLIVRLQVKHEDYVRVRGRLGRVDNLLALPPPSTHVDHSRLSSLDLAVTVREGKPRTEDITTLYREVQSAVQTTKEKSKQEVKVPGQVLRGRKGNALRREGKMLKEEDEKPQKLILELKEKFQQLKETNKSKDARIKELLAANQTVEEGSQEKDPVKKKDTRLEHATSVDDNPAILPPPSIPEDREIGKNVEAKTEALQTAKQLVGSGSQQIKDPLQLMSDTHSVETSEATNTGQAFQSHGKDVATNVGLSRVRQPWVRKARFGGEGSGSGEFMGPYGVAVSQANEVYIADSGNSRIQVFTMDGVYIREFTTTLPGETGGKFRPSGVAVDRNGNLWVVGDGHGVQYFRDGTCLGQMFVLKFKFFHGKTVYMYMAKGQVTVTEYDHDGQNDDGLQGSGHRSPESWSVDEKGNIQARELEGDVKFGNKGSGESQLKTRQGICVDGMGNVIVANYCGRNGDVKMMFDLCDISGMGCPWAVAVSPSGDVVVTDVNNHTVSVWTH